MQINIKSTYRLIRSNWLRLLILDIIYKSILVFLVVPFASFALNLALKTTKYSYITTDNVFHFISYPQTILAVVCIMIVLAIVVQIEAASLLFFFEDCKNHKRQNIAQLVIAGVKSFCSLMRRKCFMVPVYSLGIALFLNTPFIYLALKQSVISSYLMKSFLSNDYRKLIAIIVLVLLFFACYCKIFVLPLCILDKMNYEKAKTKSNQYLKKHKPPVLCHLIGVNLVLLVIFIFIYFVCLAVLIVGINQFVNRKIAIPLFLQNFQQLNRIVVQCISMLYTIVNYALVSSLYVRASKPEIHEVVHMDDSRKDGARFRLRSNIRRQFKNAVVIIVILCGLTTYSYFYNTMRNGRFRAEQALLGMQITAHRGYSDDAPENTIPALEKAIESYADYAEIDVQLTKDNVVVLCHDSNLYRTGGKKVKIIDLTYEQLQEYDVGSYFSKDFEKTYVPTLEEVLKLCKGKISLNIELKRIKKQQELVDRVVQLIEDYDFERQCVISSMSYEALKMVKEINPEIKTGYIMRIAYGNFYENSNIDFFSLKSSIVTEEIVKHAHMLGKEIHVWTVNKKDDIIRMNAIGVDNIISDNPVYVQEVLYEGNSTTLFQYIKLIMKK